MDISIILFGNVENPLVQVGTSIRKIKEIYEESPLMAFLVSIPHCIFNSINSVLEKEGIGMKCRIRTRYFLDQSFLRTGIYKFSKISIEVIGFGCDYDELKEVVEKVKRECPIYLSFMDRMEVIPVLGGQ
ncbi:OsmC family protein [Metallosphaera hakonensis]|uniref:Oxidoreductase n=1 Tax=Metallosphaera hakonensis JCM 8857 = DSM 7519 TaxID=1293036 RepID=A0A2U9IRS4_9CREN|nr:OsmC family protein [Metallosphaera hakonensis]AWR98739.1 OsmC family peroxiredoxin [Metallosphaera hakonensis JCM 8857 = DSM 7519]